MRLAVLAVGVSAAAAVGGGWRYAVYQWRAAQSALARDRPAEARGRLKLCLWVWPRSPEVEVWAARAARLTNDLTAAEAHLDRARHLQGGASGPVQIELLLVRLQSGELDEVAPTLIDAVEAGKADGPLVLETLARSYMYRLRYKMAYGCLSRWIDFQPESAKAHHWRGWTLERLDNPRAAMADYRRALELDPGQLTARLRVAEMLLEDKQAPEAVPHLEQLIRRSPDDPVVQARLGACRLLEGRLDDARRLLEAAAAKLRNSDPSLTIAMANLDLQEGRWAEAERRLCEALVVEPSDTEALFLLSSAQRLQGRPADAAQTSAEYDRRSQLVKRANDMLINVADSPTAGADDYAEIGRLLLGVGRDKLGLYWLDRSLERNPSHQVAHRALADYYERKGDATRAATHRRQLHGTDPPPVAPPTPSR